MKFFISYSREDQYITKKITKALQQNGVDYWIDLQDIKIGDEIRSRIKNGLENATHLILIWSKNSKNSLWVNRELDYISSLNNLKLSTIILKLDDSPLPFNFSNHLYHQITKKNCDTKINKIIRGLKQDTNLQIEYFKQKVVHDYQNFKPEPIVTEFKNFDGYRYYVSQTYEKLDTREEGFNIVQDILNIIKKNKPKFIPICGSYGCGKTTFCHYLFYYLCKDYFDDIFPIFINLGMLREWNSSSSDLKFSIHDYLIGEYGFDINLETLEKKISDGKIIFILDGFDEISKSLDEGIQKANLDAILDLAKENIVILTMRQSYLSQNVEKNLIRYHGLIKIQNFNQEQINQFIHRRFTNNLKISNLITKTGNFNLELTSKPLFLKLICDNYEQIARYSIVNESVIFQTIIKTGLMHLIGRNNIPELKISKEITILENLLEIIATEQSLKNSQLTIEEIILAINREFLEESGNIFDNHKYILESTFLVKDGNKFGFVIKPLMEYFIAQRFVRDVDFEKTDSILQKLPAIRTNETFEFIRDILNIEWSNTNQKLVQHGKREYHWIDPKESLSKVLFDIIFQVRNISSPPLLVNLIKILFLTKSMPDKPDLSYLNLRGIVLNSPNLSNANLRRADLREANLSNANLRRADLREANLSNANLRRADLREANLSNANLRRADLREVVLSKSLLRGADLSETDLSESDLRNSDGRHSRLDGANLSQSNLRFVDLSDSNLRRADLREVVLSKSLLRGADLSETDLSESDLRFTNFSYANLYESTFNHTNLTHANLQATNLTRSSFRRCNLSDVVFEESELHEVIFEDANLSHVNFNYANLSHVNFNYANLTGANFNNATLSSADFYGAILNNVNFKNAELNQCEFPSITINNKNFEIVKNFSVSSEPSFDENVYYNVLIDLLKRVNVWIENQNANRPITLKTYELTINFENTSLDSLQSVKTSKDIEIMISLYGKSFQINEKVKKLNLNQTNAVSFQFTPRLVGTHQLEIFFYYQMNLMQVLSIELTVNKKEDSDAIIENDRSLIKTRIRGSIDEEYRIQGR